MDRGSSKSSIMLILILTLHSLLVMYLLGLCGSTPRGSIGLIQVKAEAEAKDTSYSCSNQTNNNKYTEYIMIHKPTVKKKIHQIIQKLGVVIKDTIIQFASFTVYLLNELREIDLLA